MVVVVVVVVVEYQFQEGNLVEELLVMRMWQLWSNDLMK